MNRFFLISFLIIFSVFNFAQSNVIRDGNKIYFADRIIVKFNEPQNTFNKISNGLIAQLGISEISQKFKNIKEQSIEAKELNKIYTLKFSKPYNPLFLIKELKKSKNVEWAEPHYLYELTFDPNDPDTNANRHLDVIQAKKAWDINQGSEDIIIAIVDTGVEWLHEDLADNIWTNVDEIPNNGIDDDGNDYVDDIRGWDFGGSDGTPDNDPNEDRADHGTHVAGLASAVTNNGIGIASIGFKSKIMSVKTAQNDLRNDQGIALIAYGYEGILYAAENGAKIINCSWGGYNYSYSAQAVIDYAVSLGALVIASAGNSGSSDNFYPASYKGVLSVGGTSFVDQKASWSNYGTNIDVCSPGINIWSTWFGNTYAAKSGTSMSSPIVAGLAALVANQFPNYSPLQIAEQVRVTSDDLYNINPSYQYKLGYGRINAFNALNNNSAKSVRINNVVLTEVGDGDGVFESGEEVKVGFELTNYLNSISNLNVTFSTTNNNITIIKNGGTISSMNSLDNFETGNDFLQISIKPDATTDVDAQILVSYSAGEYSDFEWITISINPTYLIHSTENLAVTFSSVGTIGFNDYPDNLKGNGLVYKDGTNLLFEGALIYGTSAQTIVNSARSADPDYRDNDFIAITPIKISTPGILADKESYCKFNDAFASPKSLGIETEVYTYSFDDEQFADFIFARYIFNNTTNEIISNFYTGQFWDFDIDADSYDDDMLAYDFTNNFAYAFDNDGNPTSAHIGLALLSSDKVGFYAMKTTDSITAYDGFTDEEKWITLTGGLQNTSKGPDDISCVISGGPFSILPNSNLTVDFLIAAGDGLTNLTNNVILAKSKYQDLITKVQSIHGDPISRFELLQNYPNPFNPSTTIKYSIPNVETHSHASVRIIVYDILGREITTLVNQNQKPGRYEIEFNAGKLSSGIYFYKISAGSFSDIKKMILLK